MARGLILVLGGGVLTCGSLTLNAQTPDACWTVSDYVRIGVPDPDKFWRAIDYANFSGVLRGLDRTNRAALPRIDSDRSGPIFARLINSSNTLYCLEANLPPKDRLALHQALISYLPSILDMYKLSGMDATFHRETVELAHTHLHLVRLSIEFDGKPIPGVSNSPPIRLSESSVTPWNAPYADPDNYRVPRNGSFGVAGAHAATTLTILLPWLGDRTVIPVSERVDAIRYLNEDVPVIWRHIVPATRKSLLQELDFVIDSTRQPQVREGLEQLRKELQLSGAADKT